MAADDFYEKRFGSDSAELNINCAVMAIDQLHLNVAHIFDAVIDAASNSDFDVDRIYALAQSGCAQLAVAQPTLRAIEDYCQQACAAVRSTAATQCRDEGGLREITERVRDGGLRAMVERGAAHSALDWRQGGLARFHYAGGLTVSEAATAPIGRAAGRDA